MCVRFLNLLAHNLREASWGSPCARVIKAVPSSRLEEEEKAFLLVLGANTKLLWVSPPGRNLTPLIETKMSTETEPPCVEEYATVDITEPRDTDVLCGRGGAALRHPGNQTYRRLVNLNKGLYITCLKTEKLKISRSIVAAIREQNGRFLEKDNAKGTWYDIGDKKAIEKTSQALREGQPKLRQKIVEMGGGVSGTAAFMESQYGHTGLYNPEQVGLTSSGIDEGMQQQQMSQQSLQGSQSMASGSHAGDPMAADHLLSRLSISDVSLLSGVGSLQSVDNFQRGSNLDLRSQRMRTSQVPRSSQSNPLSLGGYAESQHSLMSEYSLYGANSLASGSSNQLLGNQHPQMPFDSLRLSMPNESLECMNVDSSMPKQYSGFYPVQQQSGSFSSNLTRIDNMSFLSIDGSVQSTFPYSTTNGFASSASNGFHTNTSINTNGTSNNNSVPQAGNRDKLGFDRRRIFAKMKYNRPPSDRHHNTQASSSHRSVGMSQHTGSFADGMKDFSMVDSSASLYSNFSGIAGVDQNHAMYGQQQGDNIGAFGRGTGETMKLVDHNRLNGLSDAMAKHHGESVKVVDQSRLNAYSDAMGSGSRRSIMSGLSRISDTSVDHSIFSDLSRKIGNVSTRSLAMSEISAMDTQDRDTDDLSTGSQHHIGVTVHMGVLTDESKYDQPLEFHL